MLLAVGIASLAACSGGTASDVAGTTPRTPDSTASQRSTLQSADGGTVLTTYTETISGKGTCFQSAHPGEWICEPGRILTPSGSPTFTSATGYVSFGLSGTYTVSGSGVSPTVSIGLLVTGPSGTEYCLGTQEGTGTTGGRLTTPTSGLANVYLPEGPGTYTLLISYGASTAQVGDDPQTSSGTAKMSVSTGSASGVVLGGFPTCSTA